MGEALSDYLNDLVDASRSSGGDEGPCSASKAFAITHRLETSLNNIEGKIRGLPIIQSAKPEIQSLQHSLSRDRRLILEARAIYTRVKVETGSECS